MNVIVRKLIAKELYLNRWFMLGATLAGVASVLLAAAGTTTAFNIGALTWLTTMVAYGVMLAIYGVANERKEHSLLYVITLPLSIADYIRAKQVGLTLTFLVPWLASSIAVVLLILLHPDIPDGLLPFATTLCVFLLANFALVLCGALHARSEALMTTVIVVTNMGVSVFMFTVGPLPAISKHLQEATPVWNGTIWTVLAIEIFFFILALVLPRLIAARRRDFI